MLDYELRDITLAFGTLLGAFSIFPEPPRKIKRLTENVFFQWILVFILVWQGGANQDLLLSLIITLVTFILFYLLNKLLPDNKEEHEIDISKAKKMRVW